MKILTRLGALALVPCSLGGCAVVGVAAEGIGQLIGLAIGLASALAGPALAYYLYQRQQE